MADLCEKTGANVSEVAKGLGLDKRIGPKFLHAGVGYGGSCLPKDVSAILRTAGDAKADLRVIGAASAVNESRIDRLLGKLEAEMPDVSGKRIAVLGLSFKPNTDDLRHAPSLKLIDILLKRGARIAAYDPIAMDNAKEKYGDSIEFFDDAYSAMTGADALILMTEWNEFRQLDLDKIREVLAEPIVIDCRNIYKPSIMNGLGFRYHSFGRPDDSDV
jgi:UDPglucose 6-dehydrogenase